MMLGRDESMPNVVREPDLTSEERDLVRVQAREVLAGRLILAPPASFVMARAILRYVPAGVPASAPHPVAAADDMTRPTVAEARCDECDPSFGCFAAPAQCRKRPLTMPAGVICEPIAPDPSDGICEVSDDGSTQQVGKLNFTAAYDPSVHGEITRK